MFIQAGIPIAPQDFTPELTPIYRSIGVPDIYFEPAAPNLAGWRNFNYSNGTGQLYNFGYNNKGSLWGSLPSTPVYRENESNLAALGNVNGSSNNFVSRTASGTYTSAKDIGGTGVTVFLVFGNCIDEDTTQNVFNVAGINFGYVDASGGAPGWNFSVGINEGGASNYTKTNVLWVESGFRVMTVSVYPTGGGLNLAHYNAWVNGIQVDTDQSIGVDYNGADETTVATGLVRFDMGSLIRYPFTMNTAQVSSIVNYLETIYGTFV